MALRPHDPRSNNNMRGISELRVLVRHKKSLSTQQAAGRDNHHHHPESYATNGFGLSAEEEKRLGLSTRNAAFGEDRGSLRRRRKDGLAAAAHTGGGGGGGVDLKGAATHFASHPSTPRPPAAPATPPPRSTYYEYCVRGG
ncbi:expressed unknown protein [Ectocarpus siliculosus]|uniref:Uncharacterized protein n=1 Tax=Ectocarpus siliculosus TaxID=2880 RepID=D7G195_ECTSI|nr:expressed unknown protein [Ectocarpus siliculosus]|eukprot:CBJ33205.1 expressed unknown protein [Ectocarpus siliculosus]